MPGKNQASRRLDRILRTQRIGGVLLLLGSAAFLLGAGLVLLTLQYSPEQFAAIVRAKAWTHDFFLLLPAPEHYRLMGGVIMLVGMALLGLGALVRTDQWWYR
jgi:hypothetical protein